MVRKMCMTFLGAFIFVCLCNYLSVFSAYGENLRIKSLKVTKKGSQSGFYLGHPITLTGKLSSDETVEDVGINFYIIEKGKEGEENAYYFIGSHYIVELKAGTKKFEVEAQLPTDATAGNYYVVGVIDPLDMTEESNEDDNDYKIKKTIKLSDEYIDTPDLIVEDFLLDLDAFPVYKEDAGSMGENGGSSIRPKIRNNILSNGTVESTDLYDADIKGTLIVSSSATSSEGVSIRFTLQYKSKDICPLWVWDSSENTYKNEYVVDKLPENELVSIPVDLLIPPNSDLYETVDPDNSGMYTVEDIINQIEEQGESYTVKYEEDEGEEGKYEDEYKSEYEGEETKRLGYTIKVEIDPGDSVYEYDESADDNVISKKVLLFNVSSSDDTGAYAKKSPKQGDTTEESGRLEFDKSYPKYFLGKKNAFLNCGMNFLAKTSLDRDGAKSDVNLSIPVTILGNESKLINIEGSAVFNQQDSEQSSFEFVIKLLGETIYEQSTLDVDWSYPVEQSIYSGTYRGYVIPIKFTVTASGTVGLKGTAEVSDNLDISITPSLEIGINASAEANAFGFASVSLNGESTLIKDELTITNTGSLELNEDQEVTNGKLFFRIENDLYGPEGELYATASWRWFGEKTKTWPLTNWKLWHRNDTLFDKTESIEF